MAALVGIAAVGIGLVGIAGLSSMNKKKLTTTAPRRRQADFEDLPSVADTLYNPPIMPAVPAPGGDSVSTYRGASVYTPGLIDRSGSAMYANPYIDVSSPEYQDQSDWQLDCGGRDGVPATCGLKSARDSGHRPPLRGQHLAESVGMVGDYLSEVQMDTRRDAEVEINEDPCPTRTYPDYGFGWGEPLESSYIPHGAHAQTDLEFWGPRDYDAERFHKIPSYLFNREQELNGKEINRPWDDYTMQFDQDGDERDVDWGTGAKSGRTPDVKYLAANRSQSFATTTRPWEEKKFMPPVANRGGFSMPAPESLIYFGGHSEPVYNAFSGLRSMGSRSAPSDAAEIQLPAHTRNPQQYAAYHGGAVGKTQSYGAEGVNLIQGGRMNMHIDYTPPVDRSVGMGGEMAGGLEMNPQLESRVRRVGTRYALGGDDDGLLQIPGVWDTQGAPAFRIGVNAGQETNPADGGYMRRTRVRERPFAESTIGMGMSSGPIRMENMMSGARIPKSDGARKDYKTVGGGISGWIGGADPLSFKKSTIFTLPASGGGATSGGIAGPRSVFTVHGNNVIGTRGATYSEEPTMDDVGDAQNGSLYRNIVGKRSQEELDDLFEVEHS